ncbi:phosphopantothenoylcysteine decarboxylase / phosphopantothenate--cysteine ligase [Lishizhenia tianjinensis]|uniref:Coenzyme A biosynthesis bifunctional protein CoaBC n=1 Tax=Lishizhenia tianjinensis TaxID=477690 RepID=A0A1I6Z1Q4_9FLAO|nr:bifunctional phosphopantothenoylcysteine decarboxylase/phosphopantothenate--cysteine ligase CoaBC [Lishizhenia tianjinensis]SFT56622.1 phosphopantothenoylcysteine decarboxylase / phosphopantothenate--cysteine ligase [Lishizhenia tianjinensis]
MLQGKKIVLGITGGIAAYKIASLIRLLIKNGAEVKCIMTSASVDFITPLTVATLSKNPVSIDFWNKENGEWTNHVDLGMWGDLMLIAPLTANTLFKIANGCCDNLLTATYLSAKCPVMVAPAMDLDMYAHPSSTRNLEQIQKDGVKVIPAQSGELASGLVGQGRMTEPEDIFEEVKRFFIDGNKLAGKRFVVTAGPTYEAIDPVRFIGNHSSGKMGVSIAKALLSMGAEVDLILGPSKQEIHHERLNRVDVKSAEDMLAAVQAVYDKVDGGVFAAAVADYRPKTQAAQKIKKKADSLTIELVKNPDVLGWAGANKKEQFLVGFALETNNALEHGKGKLARKNLDAIIINTLEDKGAGFGGDTNKITLLEKDNNFHNFELKSKDDVAYDIVNFIANKL